MKLTFGNANPVTELLRLPVNQYQAQADIAATPATSINVHVYPPPVNMDLDHKSYTLADGQVATQLSSLVPATLAVLRPSDNVPDFKSIFQAQAISHVLTATESLLVVLPTGGGKTMIITFPVIAERGQRCLSVAIIPLAALHHQLQNQVRELGISFKLVRRQDLGNATFLRELRSDVYELLIVSVEVAIMAQFQAILTELTTRGKLRRVFIDEAHLIVTWSGFRMQMAQLSIFSGLAVPLVLLTATMPPIIATRLQTSLRRTFATIRAPTFRPNLAYNVDDFRSYDASVQDAVEMVTTFEREQPRSSPVRAIVFFPTRREVDTFYQLCGNLPVSRYHAGMDEDERERHANHWHSGDTRVMVATSAFGMGIDQPYIHLILHPAGCSGLLDYVQETGRGGRAGEGTIIIASRFPGMRSRLEDAFSGDAAMEEDRESSSLARMLEYLENTTICRRWLLHRYVDNLPLTCQMITGTRLLCDVCSAPNTNVPFEEQPIPQPTSIALRQVDQAIAHPMAVVEHWRQLQGRQLSLRIKELLDTLQGCGICCVVQKGIGPRKNHAPATRDCTAFRNKCRICLETDHQSVECVGYKIPPGVKSICYLCGLPALSNGISFHSSKDAFGNRCDSRGRGFARSLVWWAWKQHRSSLITNGPQQITSALSSKFSPNDDSWFHHWMYDQTQDTYNMLFILLFVLEKYTEL